ILPERIEDSRHGLGWCGTRRQSTFTDKNSSRRHGALIGCLLSGSKSGVIISVRRENGVIEEPIDFFSTKFVQHSRQFHRLRRFQRSHLRTKESFLPQEKTSTQLGEFRSF